MGLNKGTLIQEIKEALDVGSDSGQDLDNPVDADAIRQTQANNIADAVDNYIRSMTITVSGINTTGGSTAQSQVQPVEADIS